MEEEPPKKKKPIRYRKKPKAEPIPQDRLYSVMKGLEEKDQALGYLLYLTGCRIREGLRLTANNFYTYEKEGQERWGVKMPTLKNRKSFMRDIPIIVKTQTEREMFLFMAQYLAKMPEGPLFSDSGNAITNRFRKIRFTTNLTNEREKTYSSAEYRLHPHYLRHCRLSHLAESEKLSDQELVALAGWTDSRPASTYVRLVLDRLR